jgi:hypothetical protein
MEMKENEEKGWGVKRAGAMLLLKTSGLGQKGIARSIAMWEEAIARTRTITQCGAGRQCKICALVITS